MLKKLKKAVRRIGKNVGKALKKPVGAAVVGKGIGAKLAKIGARRVAQKPGMTIDNRMGMPEKDEEVGSRAGAAGTATFKRGGLADKKGRAMKKPGADAMGRAMTAKPKKMMGGGMTRGYKRGGMAKKGC